jgi:uncharacterized protein YcbX
MELQSINIYPIKSLGGINLPYAQVTRRGFEHDRVFMLVDKKGKFISQRDFPKMALVKTLLDESFIHISTPTMSGLKIPLLPSSELNKVEVSVWGTVCFAQHFSLEMDKWFSEYLNTECRLVFMPKEYKRSLNSEFKVFEDDHVSFADGYPYLLIGSASLDDLNQRLESPVKMNRFRPNLVIKTEIPFIEDTWKKIKIGEVVFQLMKPCARCQITTINQETLATTKEPLLTLSKYRLKDKKILFGQNLIPLNEAKLQIGDKLIVF